MRVLLDTNILVDALTCRPPAGDEAVKLFTMCEMGDVEAFIPAQSFADAFYILRKENKSLAIQEWFVNVLSYMQVCSLTKADIAAAAQHAWPDFEDCLVAHGAQKIRADYLLTRNAEGFAASAVPALSPKDFFAMLENEYGIVYDVLDL